MAQSKGKEQAAETQELVELVRAETNIPPADATLVSSSSHPTISTMTNLFQTTFENGDVSDWRLSVAPGQLASTAGWEATREADESWVLNGKGHTWANLAARHNWGDFILRVRLRVLQGGVHLNYRINNGGRYFIGFNATSIAVMKQYFPNTFPPELGRSGVPNAAGAWHWVQIAGRGGLISVMVDGAQRVLATDPKPIVAGSIAFECLDDSWVQIAEVTVIGPAVEQTSAGDPNLIWVRTGGPLGGIGYDVRIDPTDPQVLYVTDAFSGVSKSTNGGTSWFSANEGIISRTGASGDSIPVFCLTIEPHNPNVLWCGTQGMRGIYKSTDGGAHWLKCDHGIPDLEGITFRSLTVDPTNPEVVYAGTEIPTPQRGEDGQNQMRGKIFKTIDAGKNWSEILDCGALVRWMAIDSSDAHILYAATGIFDRDCVQREGVLKSTDGGKTWRHINEGLPNLTVGGLVMDRRNPRVLYAATGRFPGFGREADASYGGVYKTTDGGDHWVEVLHRQDDDFTVSALALAPSNPDVVYASPGRRRFYRSRDAGATWQFFALTPEGASAGVPIALSVSPADAQTTYLNSYIGGVFKSTDAGQSWRISSQGYCGAQLSDVGIDPHNPALVYAIGRLGVAKSQSAGASWVYFDQNLTPNNFNEGGGISVNPEDGKDVLAAPRHYGNILRTRDGGLTWQEVQPKIPNIGPANFHGWIQFARCRQNPAVIYAAGARAIEAEIASLGVIKSTDGGQHWQTVNTGLIKDLNMNAVTVHPTDPRIAYAGTLNGGVYQTTDGGERWHESSRAFARNVRTLAVHPSNPRCLFAGTEMNGLFVSNDTGRTWEPAGAGLDPNASIRAITFDPSMPNVIWVADVHTGVYRSVDGGKMWIAVNSGLRTRAVTALAISADGHVLYAATDGEGVFRLEIKVPPSTAVRKS
jgi:photosystem II stability/assembly factor-like uncharacterized protein